MKKLLFVHVLSLLLLLILSVKGKVLTSSTLSSPPCYVDVAGANNTLCQQITDCPRNREIVIFSTSLLNPTAVIDVGTCPVLLVPHSSDVAEVEGEERTRKRIRCDTNTVPSLSWQMEVTTTTMSSSQNMTPFELFSLHGCTFVNSTILVHNLSATTPANIELTGLTLANNTILTFANISGGEINVSLTDMTFRNTNSTLRFVLGERALGILMFLKNDFGFVNLTNVTLDNVTCLLHVDPHRRVENMDYEGAIMFGDNIYAMGLALQDISMSNVNVTTALHVYSSRKSSIEGNSAQTTGAQFLRIAVRDSTLLKSTILIHDPLLSIRLIDVTLHRIFHNVVLWKKTGAADHSSVSVIAAAEATAEIRNVDISNMTALDFTKVRKRDFDFDIIMSLGSPAHVTNMTLHNVSNTRQLVAAWHPSVLQGIKISNVTVRAVILCSTLCSLRDVSMQNIDASNAIGTLGGDVLVENFVLHNFSRGIGNNDDNEVNVIFLPGMMNKKNRTISSHATLINISMTANPEDDFVLIRVSEYIVSVSGFEYVCHNLRALQCILSPVIVASRSELRVDRANVTIIHPVSYNYENYMNGCVHLLGEVTALVSNSHFSGCRSISSGAVFKVQQSTLVLVDTGMYNSWNNYSLGLAVDNGGVVSLEDASSLTMQRCTVKDAVAYNIGGAIAILKTCGTSSSACRLVVQDSNFTDTRSDGGGGCIAIDSDFYVAILTNIRITNSQSARGGAIFISHAHNVSIENVFMMNTISTGGGGAIQIGAPTIDPQFTSVNITNVTILHSLAQEDGGAMLISAPSTLKNIYIQHAHGRRGGALAIFMNARIKGLEIRNASADSDGGGIYFEPSAHALDLRDVYVEKAVSKSVGGCIALCGCVTARNITMSQCVASISGSVISMSISPNKVGEEDVCVDIKGLWSDQTQADSAGCLFVDTMISDPNRISVSDVVLNGCSANSGSSGGGALSVISGAFSMNNFTVFNTSSQLVGGAFQILGSNANVRLSNGRVVSSAAELSGSCLYISNEAHLTITDTDFYNCTFSVMGGIVPVGSVLACVHGASVAMTRVRVSYLNPSGARGFIFAKDVLHFENCQANIDGLRAVGVSVYRMFGRDDDADFIGIFDTSVVVITDSAFSDIDTVGSTVYVDPSATVELRNTRFGNLRTNSVVAVHGNASLVNVTISDAFSAADGVIAALYKSKLWAHMLYIERCHARRGAGLFLDNAAAGLSSIFLISNTAQEKGGGLFISKSMVVLLDDQSFVTNCSAVLGGGVYLDGTFTDLRKLAVMNCHATIGGAMFLQDTFMFIPDRPLMRGNTALLYGDKIATAPSLHFTGPDRVMPGRSYGYPFCFALQSNDYNIDPSLCEYNLATSIGTMYFTDTLTPITGSTPVRVREEPCVEISFFFPLSAKSATLSVSVTCQNIPETLSLSETSLDISPCPSMFEWSSGACAPCTFGRYSASGYPCQSCPRGVLCDTQRALMSFPSYPNVTLANFSDDDSWLRTAIHSEVGHWWHLDRASGSMDVRLCPVGLCAGNNECGSRREWNSTMCTRCAEDMTAWGRKCVECSDRHCAVILARFACILLFVAVVHHSSSGSSAAVRIFMQQLEVVALIVELRAFLDVTQSDSDSIFQSTFSIASNAISQGVALFSCIGAFSSLEHLLSPIGHMLALVIAVPIVTVGFRRHIPMSCWRQTLSALLLLFVQMSSRQLLESIACVSGSSAYHPSIACDSHDMALARRVYAIAFVTSVVLVIGVVAYVVHSTHARRYPWPVFFGAFRWQHPLTRWWIVATTSRRVLFVVAYVCGSMIEPQLSVVSMSAVAMLFAIAQHCIRPYVHRCDNNSDMASQLGILIILQCVECRALVFGCAVLVAMIYPASMAAHDVAFKAWGVATRARVLVRRVVVVWRARNDTSDDNNSNNNIGINNINDLDDEDEYETLYHIM
eukprot:PhM_4_TR14243/c1_g1_i1/m.63103